MANEYVLRIPAKLEGMDVILAFVSYLLDINGCSAKARTQLRIAVEELYAIITAKRLEKDNRIDFLDNLSASLKK
jgi:hypothetical protein